MLSRDSPAEFSEPVEGEEGVELKVHFVFLCFLIDLER